MSGERIPPAPYPRRARYSWKVLPSVPAGRLENTLNELEAGGWTINGAHMERGDGGSFVVTATCVLNEDGHDHNRTGTYEQYRALLRARDAAVDDADRALIYDASVTFWYHLPPSEQKQQSEEAR